MDNDVLVLIKEHIEGIVGGLTTFISYFIGSNKEKKKETENKIDRLQNEIESAYKEIVENTKRKKPNIASNRYKLPLIDRKIKELCKLKKMDHAKAISEHARLCVYATDDQCVDQQKVSEQATKVIEELSNPSN